MKGNAGRKKGSKFLWVSYYVEHWRGLGICCCVRPADALIKERKFWRNHQTSQQTKSVANFCWRMRKCQAENHWLVEIKCSAFDCPPEFRQCFCYVRFFSVDIDETMSWFWFLKLENISNNTFCSSFSSRLGVPILIS